MLLPLPDLGVRKSSLLSGRTVCPVTDVQSARVAKTTTDTHTHTQREREGEREIERLGLCEVQCRVMIRAQSGNTYWMFRSNGNSV